MKVVGMFKILGWYAALRTVHQGDLRLRRKHRAECERRGSSGWMIVG